MRTSLRRTVGPVSYPISADEAKDHLRVSGTVDDDLILRYIAAATGWAEQYLNRALVSQTWQLKLDHFPCSGDREIKLPKPPLISVTSITYVDTAGATQTLATDHYTVVVDDWSPKIHEAYGVSWPSTRSIPGAVTVTYVAGYSTIPAEFQAAIWMHVQGQYDNLPAADAAALEQTIKTMIKLQRVPVI